MSNDFRNFPHPTLKYNDIKRLGGEHLYNRLKSKYHRDPAINRGNIIAPNASAGNGVIVVGEQPQAFGKTFIWDRKDEQILLAVFVNAADNLGISILGLEPRDVIQVTSAAGIASFSKDKGNPAASSLVGLIGAGAKAGLGIAGLPEAIPFVTAAEKFAQDQFKATNTKNKVRNAFGVDPASGHKAKQEGGIVISFPEAGEPYYSGDGDHQERWIKSDGTRTDNHRPNHVVYGFFPIAGNLAHNTRSVYGSYAPLYISAWNFSFDDNAGYYKIFVLIQKGPKESIVT